MNRLFNTLKISCLVIGGVIGAGFISGREIMTFFYGYNKYFSSIILFIVLFLLIYLLLRLKNVFALDLIKKSNVLILLFNLLIMASMLAATDSLAEGLFGTPKNIPIFSIGLLILSTLCCMSGFSRLSNVSAVIVPILIIIFFSAIIVIPTVENTKSILTGVHLYSCVSYGALNIFLIQPFLIKIKEERKDYSPFWVAFLSSIVLVLAIFAFLGVLSEDCISCDIPLILLAKSNKYLYYLLSLIIFIGIFTTLTAVQYPFCSLTKNGSFLALIIASVIAFAISRVGFYTIVDKVYPAMSLLSIIYYFFIIAISLFFSLKGQRSHTLRRQEDIKLRYLP